MKSKEERLKEKIERIKAMFPDPKPNEVLQIAAAIEKAEADLKAEQNQAQ